MRDFTHQKLDVAIASAAFANVAGDCGDGDEVAQPKLGVVAAPAPPTPRRLERISNDGDTPAPVSRPW